MNWGRRGWEDLRGRCCGQGEDDTVDQLLHLVGVGEGVGERGGGKGG